MAMDWAKWMRDCLSERPSLTQAGLARHLGHGRDQSKVARMLKGTRRIRTDEIEAAAIYFGVPIPIDAGVRALATPTGEVPIMGVISRTTWAKRNARPYARVFVPPINDPRYLAADQMRYEIADAATRRGFAVGDQVICVPFAKYRSGPQPNDIIVTERRQGDLVSFTLAEAKPANGSVELISAMDHPTSEDLGQPVALVIAFFRSLT